MGSLCTNCLVLEGQREAGSVAGGFIRLMLGDTTAHHLTGVMASSLTSPGNASNCNLPSVAPRHFSALVLIHPHSVFPAQLPQPGSFLPVGMLLSGCGFSGSAGAWRVQEHPNGRRRLVGSATSCAPAEPPPVCHSTAGTGTSSHHCPSPAPCHRPCTSRCCH